MCLIITRDPNIELDKESFLTACKINPNGWGLSVPDYAGKLHTYKSVETDAEDLYEFLNTELINDHILLHLRYTTAGDTILRNAHPFPILEEKTDGVDVRMAHNGTLHKYKPSLNSNNRWESDTRVFARTYVRPLMKRLIRGVNSWDLFEDEFVQDLIDNELTGSSVLAFMDGFGNIMHVNALGNGGKFEEGYWVSNKYSFDPKHREPQRVYGGAGNGWKSGRIWNYQTQSWEDPKPTNNNITRLGQKYMEDTMTKKFTEKWDIKESDLLELDDEFIDELIAESDDDTGLLLKELLYLYYHARKENAGLQGSLKKVTKERDALTQEVKEKNKQIERQAKTIGKLGKKNAA